MQLDIAQLRRILVVRLDNIGDVVMLTPALRALRARLPDARLTLMASPAGALVAPMMPWIDEVIAHRTLWQDAHAALAFDPARELAFIRNLRERRFDAAIIFTSFSQTPHVAAYACYLAGIPVRAAQAPDFAGSVLSHVVSPLTRERHQIDRNLHLLAMLGIPCERPDPELVLPAVALERAAARLRRAGVDGPYIVLAPGASCAARRYPAARFAMVAQRLVDDLAAPVVVIGTDRDREHAPELERLDRQGVVSSLGQTDLSESAALISRAALVVCNNSAPMHIAEAFARPIVALYSGSDLESQWRPRRAPVHILRRSTACAPCYRFDCPYGLECLDVAPAEVVDAARTLLRESQEPRARVA